MTFQPKENTGVLFKNDRKEQPNHPDYKGSADLACPHCQKRFSSWLSSWIKDGKNGKFMSLSFKDKGAALNPPAPTVGKILDAMDDEIPF